MTLKQSVLIIDDEPLFCKSLMALLESEGFRVESAFSGTEGLEMMKNIAIHGAILDMGLPDIQGDEVARQIIAYSPDVAVIILTGANDAEKGMEILRMGVFDYLLKPCDPDHLIRILRRALQQKQIQRNLREAYHIINCSPAIVFLWRREKGWPVEFVSENIAALCGYSAREFIRGEVSYTNIIHPDDLSRVSEEIRQIESDSTMESFQHKPYRIVTRDGQVKWVEDNTYLKKDVQGNISHLQGIVLDITRKKQEQEIIQRVKRQWEQVFDAIPSLITLQDRNMRVIRANKAAVDFFQIDYREILGKYCYQLFCQNEVPCAECSALQTFADGKSHTHLIEHESWNKIFIETSSPVVNKVGEVTHLVHTAKDVTEQKQLESHLLQAHKMEAIGTLAGGIAHDFNNLLTVILGSAEVIKYGMQSGLDPADNLDQILEAGKRASSLVKQLLTFSRNSEHKLQPFEPYLIVKEAVKMLDFSFPSTVQIKNSIDSNSGTILADPTRLYQIVVELCSNGLHAMPEEKGVLAIRLRRQFLEAGDIPEQEAKPGPYIVLSVSDTGSGMKRDTLQRVFEPYYTTKDLGKGSGLGLAVLHGLVRDYHGMVRVESALGKGTTVHVYLPAIEERNDNPAAIEDVDIQGNERILVVDDESSIVSVQKITLENFGYQVTVTADSISGLSMLKQDMDRFDLLITDQTMPRLTGVELAREVLKQNPEFPIILCTGYSALISKQEALAIGIRRFLVKPVVGYELARTVREVLDHSSTAI